MSNKYAYTKEIHFKSKLNLDKSDCSVDNEFRDKLVEQFKQFNLKYKEIASRLDIKNFISFDYIRKQLLRLNETYPNFTTNPVEISIDLELNNLILEMLEKKSFGIFSKDIIMECLFNQTCIELGWCKVSN